MEYKKNSVFDIVIGYAKLSQLEVDRPPLDDEYHKEYDRLTDPLDSIWYSLSNEQEKIIREISELTMKLEELEPDYKQNDE